MNFVVHVIQSVVSGVTTAAIVLLVVRPLASRAWRQHLDRLDPNTPGGLGDMPEARVMRTRKAAHAEATERAARRTRA